MPQHLVGRLEPVKLAHVLPLAASLHGFLAFRTLLEALLGLFGPQQVALVGPVLERKRAARLLFAVHGRARIAFEVFLCLDAPKRVATALQLLFVLHRAPFARFMQ